MASRACYCCAKDPSKALTCESKRCKDSASYDPDDERKIASVKREALCQGNCTRPGWDHETCSVVYPERCKDRKIA